jgi:hypothetical protein
MQKTLPRFSIFTGMLLTTVFAAGQCPHFAGVQDVSIWYNPAMKVNKVPLAHVSVRSVRYPNIISYTSKILTIELPLVSNDADDLDNIPFMNLAAGISTDNSSNGFMVASTAMMTLSYAMPLNDNNTYFAMGIQGNYSLNRIGNGNTYYFPEKFDKNGALNWSMIMDPNATGLNFGYITAGVGVALFHTGEEKEWYVGGSIKNFNHPYTEWGRTTRLPSTNGVQFGYKAAISSSIDIWGYGNASWQTGLNEQFIGVRFIRHFNDSTNNTLGFGVGYRAYDALVPEVSFQMGNSRLALYYEINVASLPEGDYRKRAFEISYRYNL